MPGRSEYLNMNALSNTTSRIRLSVSSKSSSVSSWKPVNMSVVMPQSGMARRMAAMRSRYHSRVYLRFIALSTLLLPDCTGRWMCLHTFGTVAITSMISSVMSFGCDVVKRTRISGAASATILSRSVKPTTAPSSPT